MHVDMDAFFAAIEQRDHPEYQGKPVIVGGLSARGVVATASYEARRFGVHSAMAMTEARRRCPQGIYLRPDFARYEAASHQIRKIFACFSPIVEPLSLDEAFLEVSGMELLYDDPVAIAQEIKAAIAKEVQLVASVGLAPNKFLAKVASDMNKPDGLKVIYPGEEAASIAALPLERIWGVGKRTADILHRYGFHTIDDVAKADAALLAAELGDFSTKLITLAQGIDDRPVEPHREAASIGREITFSEDITGPDELFSYLLALAEDVGWQLRQERLFARTVTIKVRYPSFETVTRSKTIEPFSLDEEIYQTAVDLLNKLKILQPVRLLGVTVSHLTGSRPFDLFQTNQRQEKIAAVTDSLKERFGSAIVSRAQAKVYGSDAVLNKDNKRI